MRLFVGIFIPREIGSILKSHLNNDANIKFIRWVSPANWHVTLQFLGSVNPAKCADVERTLENLSLTLNPFQLGFQGGGVFPNTQRPSVFWLGAMGNLETLQVWVDQIAAALLPLGFKNEQRSYHPHLTLARINPNVKSHRDFMTAGNQFCTLTAQIKTPMFDVSEFQLIESHTDQKGSRYNSLKSFSVGPGE